MFLTRILRNLIYKSDSFKIQKFGSPAPKILLYYQFLLLKSRSYLKNIESAYLMLFIIVITVITIIIILDLCYYYYYYYYLHY
jgi:hypothetical protein